LLPLPLMVSVTDGFNPHPSRRTGATRCTARCASSTAGFNPHPSRRTGATCIAASPAQPAAGFNPHPSRRTGATRAAAGRSRSDAGFQSSPVPEDGCNVFGRGIECPVRVSILTRPGGRVQLSCTPPTRIEA